VVGAFPRLQLRRKPDSGPESGPGRVPGILIYNLYNRAGLAMCWYSTVLYFYLLSGLITVVQYSTVD
jgi:hypothetical protein